MEFSAKQIAQLLGGEIVGNPDAIVNMLSKIEDAAEHTLSFLANSLYNSYLYTTNASIVIVSKDFCPEKPLKSTCTLIKVENPRESFAILLEAYNKNKLNISGIEQPCYISNTAQVGEGIYVGAFAYIGNNAKIGNKVKIYPNVYIGENAVIGDNTILYPGVKIYSETVIGKNCTLHSGVIIGGDGFGFAPNKENNYQKMDQIGNVIIEDHVEIGSNTTIDRATLGSTIIRQGVKLDNLIQIGHNAEIGENTVIAAQTGIAGSTKVGKDCMIGGQVGIVGHITIANRVKIAAQSGISNSILKEGDVVQGSPAFSIGYYKRSYVIYKKLPELLDKIKELEKTICELTEKSV